MKDRGTSASYLRQFGRRATAVYLLLVKEVVFLVAADFLVLVVVLTDLLLLERSGVGRLRSDRIRPTGNGNCVLDIVLRDSRIGHAARQVRVA